MTAPISDQEKLAEINRELEMRRVVYPRFIRNGKMKQDQARRQIDILIAIKLDYAAKLRSQPRAVLRVLLRKADAPHEKWPSDKPELPW